VKYKNYIDICSTLQENTVTGLQCPTVLLKCSYCQSKVYRIFKKVFALIFCLGFRYLSISTQQQVTVRQLRKITLHTQIKDRQKMTPSSHVAQAVKHLSV